MTKVIKRQFSDIPIDFLQSAMRDFFDYSVVLFDYDERSADNSRPIPGSVRSLGSGTLVKCGDRHGILTAYHVIHGHSPAVRTGTKADRTLGLIVSATEHLRIPLRNLYEIPIGVPQPESDGPDMSLLVIPSITELATLKAKKSFWDLDQSTEGLRNDLKSNWTFLCTMGAPAEHGRIESDDEAVSVYTKITGYFGPYERERSFKKGEFDYIDTLTKYTSTNNLPLSFQGISGGGLWAFNPVAINEGESFEVRKRYFCGVAFYQSPLEADQRLIRHHFIDSVYTVARAKIGDVESNA